MQNETTPILAANYFQLHGLVALVTGASSGLGWHFASVLAQAGCTVGIAARREQQLLALADHLAGSPGRIIVLPTDVTDSGSVRAALDKLAKDAGAPDILVNNAGMAAPAKFLDATDADTSAVIGLNQMAVWQVAQAVCKRMVAAKKPASIINIASILGLDVQAGVASYAVSKAAVVQLTKVMALELARYNIRVNAITPGYFDTEINHDFLKSDAGKKQIQKVPMRRAGRLEDIDGTLLLLASPRNAFTTGSIVAVDGGHLVTGL